jgi:hypothetical protein
MMRRLAAALAILLVTAVTAVTARADTRAALRELLGKKPGTLGSVFAGVHFGPVAQQSQSAADKAHYAAFATGNGIKLVVMDTALSGVTDDEVTSIEAHFASAGVGKAVAAVWGKPNDPASHYWADPATHQCATITDDDKTIAWSECRTVAEVIAPARKDRFGFEPYPLLGSPLTKLQSLYGKELTHDDAAPDGGGDGWYWAGPGLPGTSSSTVTVVVIDGAITRVQFAAQPDDATEAQLAVAITKKLGVTPIHADQVTRWTSGGRRVEVHGLAGSDASVIYVTLSPAPR